MMKTWTMLACLALVTKPIFVISTPLPTCAVPCMNVAEIPLQAPSSACNNSTQVTVFENCINIRCTVQDALTTKNISEATCGTPLRDRTKSISVTGITGLSLALVALLLRIISRARNRQFGMDDWTIFMAMGFVIPLSALSIILADLGLGKDMWSIPFANITRILEVYYVDEVLYIGSLTVLKTSILCFYLRIFPQRAFKRAVYAIMASNLIYGGTFIVLSIFQCAPIQAAWTKWDGTVQAKCLDANALAWANAAINIFFDLVILILPLPEMAKLSMSWERKARVLLMFSLGSFVTIVSILRLSSLIRFANTQNVTWDYVPVGYWSTVEVHVGVICASLPALPSLLRKRPTPADTQNTQASFGYTRPGSRTKSDNMGMVPPSFSGVSYGSPSAGQIRVSSRVTVTSSPRPETEGSGAFNEPSVINKIGTEI